MSHTHTHVYMFVCLCVCVYNEITFWYLTFSIGMWKKHFQQALFVKSLIRHQARWKTKIYQRAAEQFLQNEQAPRIMGRTRVHRNVCSQLGDGMASMSGRLHRLKSTTEMECSAEEINSLVPVTKANYQVRGNGL